MKRLTRFTLAALASIGFLSAPAGLLAADHADSPTAAEDPAADIADVFFFVDPNTTGGSTQESVVLAMTVHGFITPQEAKNTAFFDPNVVYRFEVENTGDARPDVYFDVTFSKRTSPAAQQIATVTPVGLRGFKPMHFSTVLPTAGNPLTPSEPSEPLPANEAGVQFFAGQTDDPFFFDLVAFNKFIASVLAGSPDTTAFDRKRDSFAGYNVLAIAIEVPASILAGKPNTENKNGAEIGLSAATLRGTRILTSTGEVVSVGGLRQVDRMGVPAINTALIGFADKDKYNASTPLEDSKGKFVKSDIVPTLQALGTSGLPAGPGQPLTGNALAAYNLAVARGDILRLNISAAAGFPNGRQLSDPVIHTLLTVLTNGAVTSDGVDANDVPFATTFPFFAPPHFPIPTTAGSDGTEN